MNSTGCDLMHRLLHRFTLLLCLLAFAFTGPRVAANPVGDFFKKVGRSISHLGKKPTPKPTPRKSRKSSGKDKAAVTTGASETTPSPTAFPAPTPTPTPLEIRPATSAPPDLRRSRDLPYGVVVPNRPGLVTSPYAPNEGLVDVSGFPSSTEVMDPFTGKVFLTP
ncbi:MAG: hypothetical protein H0V54_06690 [Chthoniobacterales bacterium]|nr:hypothetical protein [Chthoniobacterales bacterium]